MLGILLIANATFGAMFLLEICLWDQNMFFVHLGMEVWHGD